MGTTRPIVEDHAPLVSRIERRISTATTWLTMAVRGTYIDCAVSFVPIYHMCTLRMHATTINTIDRARKHGFWRHICCRKRETIDGMEQGDDTKRQRWVAT